MFSRFPLQSSYDYRSEGEESFYALLLKTLPMPACQIARATSRDALISQVLQFSGVSWPSEVQAKGL